MPKQIGDNEYHLCGLDTNIFSEILRDPRARRGFRQLLPVRSHIPCFSPYSLFELRRHRGVYDEFVDFFDLYPCAILKNEEQLFEAERVNFDDEDEINPLLFGFSFVNKDKGTNLASLLPQVFQNPETKQREEEWPELQEELLRNWLDLKKNFPPRRRRYTNQDAIRFVRLATQQHVMSRSPEWCREVLESGGRVTSKEFPSVRMTLLTVFFRLYAAEGRRAEPQDVFDVLISTPAPYLDLVVTENFQADIYRKAKRLDRAVKHLEVLTLRDLRQAGKEDDLRNSA